MASPHVYAETKSVLQGQFSPPYQIVDFDEIDGALEQGTDPFMALEEITENEALAAFGDPSSLCQRQEGVMAVHFFTPAPESSAAARSLAELVQNFMRHRTYSGVRITAASPPEVELMNNGLWSAGAIALSYRYDFHVATP